MDTSQALCEQAQRHQRFFRQYQRLAYTVALRILKDARDAEEVASDAMARVLRAPEKYDSSRGSMKSYVALIARSQALSRLAARRDEVPAAAPEGPSAPAGAARTAERGGAGPERAGEAAVCHALCLRLLHPGDGPFLRHQPERRHHPGIAAAGQIETTVGGTRGGAHP